MAHDWSVIRATGIGLYRTSLLIAALLFLVTGLSGRESAVTTGDRIVLKDGQGTPRIVISVSADGGGELSFLDKAGKKRMALESRSEGQASLRFYDEARNERMGLGFGTGPNPVLYLRDAGGEYRILMNNGQENGVAVLTFFDQKGFPRIGLGASPTGAASISFSGAREKPTGSAILGILDDGSGSLVIHDKSLSRSIRFGTSVEGNLGARLSNDEEVVLGVALDPHGNPMLHPDPTSPGEPQDHMRSRGLVRTGIAQAAIGQGR